MYILCIYSRAKIDREDCGGNRGVSHLRRDGGRTESEKADESSTPSYLLLLHSGGGCNGGVSHLRRDSGRTESEKADESSTCSDAIVSCSYVYAQRIYIWIC